jgi:hypothetical protein
LFSGLLVLAFIYTGYSGWLQRRFRGIVRATQSMLQEKPRSHELGFRPNCCRAVAGVRDNTMRKFWIATSAVALLCISALAVEQAALHHGAWGFDATGEDRSVKPGDDFFRFANGDWLDRAPIPADRTIFGLRALMTDLTEARSHVLMEAAASQAGHEPVSLEGKVGAFYKAFQDEAHVERLGAEPLKAELDLLRPYDADQMRAWKVGKAVGNSRNTGPELCQEWE